jgi:hypothetical protein
VWLYAIVSIGAQVGHGRVRLFHAIDPATIIQFVSHCFQGRQCGAVHCDRSCWSRNSYIYIYIYVCSIVFGAIFYHQSFSSVVVPVRHQLVSSGAPVVVVCVVVSRLRPSYRYLFRIIPSQAGWKIYLPPGTRRPSPRHGGR